MNKQNKSRLKGAKNKLRLPKQGFGGMDEKGEGNTLNNTVITLLNDEQALDLVQRSHCKIHQC